MTGYEETKNIFALAYVRERIRSVEETLKFDMSEQDLSTMKMILRDYEAFRNQLLAEIKGGI